MRARGEGIGTGSTHWRFIIQEVSYLSRPESPDYSVGRCSAVATLGTCYPFREDDGYCECEIGVQYTNDLTCESMDTLVYLCFFFDVGKRQNNNKQVRRPLQTSNLP